MFRAQQIRFDPAGRLYLVGFDPISRKVVHRYAAKTFEYLDSFCDSYAGDGDLDPRVGATYAGGCLDFTSAGEILVAQYAPQRVFRFSAEGKPVTTHDARFSQSPPPPGRGARKHGHHDLPAMTTCLFVGEDDRFLATLAVPSTDDEKSYTLFDIYDATGGRLASTEIPGWWMPKCMDDEGRLYLPSSKSLVEGEDVPVVVRYRVEITEAASP